MLKSDGNISQKRIRNSVNFQDAILLSTSYYRLLPDTGRNCMNYVYKHYRPWPCLNQKTMWITHEIAFPLMSLHIE